MRFRERHQDPKSTDIEYAARINNLRRRSTASSRRIRRAVVRVDGRLRRRPAVPLPDGRAQAADRGAEISPPRTDTPKLTVGHGGCFGCIYSVRGAGGYQMFGITPMPIYDPNQEIQLPEGLHGLLPPRRYREMEADRPRRL